MFIVKIYLLNENYNSTILTVRSSIHDILLRIVFNLQLIVVVSYCQPTKHRLTLFHYIVSSFFQTAQSQAMLWYKDDAKLRKRI